ncbi:MAG: hypothetical protein EOO43_24525 [Flavobacterium sp.]|nr:MAG: hypothetical protein EOO43_24525 [Flavobacterium sp.]
MLEKDFKYYQDNQKELVKKYNGLYLIIKDCEVVGSYKTKEEAYDTATSKYELGTFLIQHCLPGTESYTQTFHSRVVLSI